MCGLNNKLIEFDVHFSNLLDDAVSCLNFGSLTGAGEFPEFLSHANKFDLHYFPITSTINKQAEP